jgi:hypothetical protein
MSSETTFNLISQTLRHLRETKGTILERNFNKSTIKMKAFLKIITVFNFE